MKKLHLLVLILYSICFFNLYSNNNTKELPISFQLIPCDSKNKQIVPNAKINLIIGKQMEVSTNTLFKPMEKEILLYAEEITPLTKDNYRITHYYIINPDLITDKFYHIFNFDNLENVNSIYVKATAFGYYPTYRKLILGSVESLNKGDIFPYTVALCKTGEEKILSRFSQEFKIDDTTIVKIPNDAVKSAVSFWIDKPGAAASMPLCFNHFIESEPILIYPYDLEFQKPINITAKPLRQKIGVKYALSIARYVPGELYAEIISNDKVKYIENDLIEFQVNKGGLYYAVFWSPNFFDKKGENTK